VVKVVITLAKSDESCDEVITGRVAVIEGLVTEPVSQRVDAESSLLNEADTENASVNETTKPVIEHETTEAGGEDKTHEDDTLQVVLVLPNDDGVLVEISDIGTASTLRVLLEHHPSEVRVQEALANRVGIILSVGITVVSSVATGPPADRALDGASANGSKVDLEG
jgi:DNA replication initiation complex subunit (GINS family)